MPLFLHKSIVWKYNSQIHLLHFNESKKTVIINFDLNNYQFDKEDRKDVKSFLIVMFVAKIWGSTTLYKVLQSRKKKHFFLNCIGIS